MEGACTLDDCNFLYGKCTETFEKYRAFHGRPPTNGRGRFAVADAEAFDFDVVSNAEAVFLNVLDALDAKMPDIYDQLFAPGQDWVARQPQQDRGRTNWIGRGPTSRCRSGVRRCAIYIWLVNWSGPRASRP